MNVLVGIPGILMRECIIYKEEEERKRARKTGVSIEFKSKETLENRETRTCSSDSFDASILLSEAEMTTCLCMTFEWWMQWE